ncbi:MAG: ABC transporter ATP-binding protein [Deltaproteobacteria bacterium]|nr:ABC transporter ATP-binding protein [Deltaproteobacteria bacterium]
MNDVIVDFQNVSRFFEEGRVRALERVSLKIYRGETVAVTGPSGSGKSTLLGLMGALDFPSSGEVKIMGSAITPDAPLARLRNEKIGFVFQQHHLLPHLNLEENVMAPLRPARVPLKEARAKSRELLDRLGLADRADFLPAKLSNGERQRAALARALINDPQLILADEPTGSLDSANGEVVVERLLRAAVGKTLVVVTHNPEISSRMGRVVQILDGRLIET